MLSPGLYNWSPAGSEFETQSVQRRRPMQPAAKLSSPLTFTACEFGKQAVSYPFYFGVLFLH